MRTSTILVAFAILIASSEGSKLTDYGISIHNPEFLWRIMEWLIPNSYIEENVFFYSYTRGNFEVPEQLWINNTVALQSSHFDVSKETVILLHGYSSDYKASSAQGPKKEYLKYRDVNVITPDYGNINHDLFCFFVYTVAKSYKIGKFLGQFLVFLIEQGVSPDSIHIVGHSLGAHIAGFAAKYTKRKGMTIGRITGLDPCLPVYEYNTANYRLDSDDAKFTDCIFTNYGVWGMGIPVCQANFFPNGVGDDQPGCYRENIVNGATCSHSLAVDYFIESVNPCSQFHVEECNGVPELKRRLAYCWPTYRTLMGEYANPQASGMFYLMTNAWPPYSRG